MVETILSYPLVRDVILPFLLVFVVIFAILQKTKILGDGKKQIDALVALVVGLIVVSFGYATGIIVSLIPFLAVAVVVILVFMILFGSAYNKDFNLANPVKYIIGVLAAIGVVIVVLVSTGTWDRISGFFLTGGANSSLVGNIVFIVVIIGAVLLAVLSGKSESVKP